MITYKLLNVEDDPSAYVLGCHNKAEGQLADREEEAAAVQGPEL